MTGVAAIFVDKFGRKPLLLLSGLGTCLSLFALGVFFYLDENKRCVSEAEIQPPLIFNQSKILTNWSRNFQKLNERLSQESLLITLIFLAFF